MKSSIYYIEARLFPTIICSIPPISLYIFGFDSNLIEFLNILEGYKWARDATLSVAIIFLLVQVNRFLSKEIFQRYFFKGELEMPTTNYLVSYNESLSAATKERLYEKLLKDFNINLAVEFSDKKELRKTIQIAVSQIRNKTRRNKLLLQHNIEYGFVRNLIGGSFLAASFALINIFYFGHFSSSTFALKLNFVLMVAYILPIVFSKLLLDRYGEYYAKVLFETYLGND